MNETNTREFSRSRTKVSIEVTSAARPPFVGQLHDVSMNGVFVNTPEKLGEGAECRVAIVLGGIDPPIRIEAHGRVVRQADDGMAINFDGIDAEGYPHLVRLVLYNSENPHRVEEELDAHTGLRRNPHDG